MRGDRSAAIQDADADAALALSDLTLEEFCSRPAAQQFHAMLTYLYGAPTAVPDPKSPKRTFKFVRLAPILQPLWSSMATLF